MADTLETALAKLFNTSSALEEASWITLSGGSRLFSAGDESDHLYLLRSGRLGVFRHDDDQQGLHLIGIIKPGEPAGEMSLIAGTPHTSTLIALRDCELMVLPKEAFLRAIETAPDVLLALSKQMIQRAREGTPREGRRHNTPNVFAFFALNDILVRPLVDKIAGHIRTLGYSVAIFDKDNHGSTFDTFSKAEAENDYVLYVAEKPESHWRLLSSRQVDHTFWIADAREHSAREKPETPTGTLSPEDSQMLDPLGLQRAPDLILIQAQESDGRKIIAHTKSWIDAFKPARWFHVGDHSTQDAARIARIVTGHSIGIVFSGGGARAFSHIGAVQALREAHIPIDFVCGSSMGGIVGACVAQEWTEAEIDENIRAAFVDSSPLDDITFPFLALTGGKKVDERLAKYFGEVLIEDLPLPFFCLSSNLTSGTIKVHKGGLMRQALRASISLPGIMPPVIEDGQVLVDGAVMRSFPALMMRNTHLGTVIGVDVTRAKGIDPKTVEVPKSLPTWFLKGDWRKGPPIVSILMRSATITTAADLEQSRLASDLLIIPEPEGVEIRDWYAYDLAVESGYQTTVDSLAKLEHPVTQLRKLGVSLHPNIPAFTPDDSFITPPKFEKPKYGLKTTGRVVKPVKLGNKPVPKM
ncbi:patatin-like phospholipase family protein [Asticcacaulis sp. BYS171W]|uniref:Patatin-like phospholipase family protein n=1 Tax=Asticcacaulis aquaticus TaxID=2984212 RepID=A0ABT5HY57_9CAUL|nr:patatin-like phospholipase family protein [Asticcacaulis aquaticus]MDC7685016.1 patatin-like phospholipase family protein [Asticcacaulis aquaticus]